MAREIDERKKRKALRKLRKAAMLAEQGLGPELSDWEKQFLEEVEERIETYGSAFADPEKGGADEPLSALQSIKLKEIDKKARGKGKSGFRQRKPLGRASQPRVRQIDETEEEPAQSPIPKPTGPKLVKARDLPAREPDEPTAPQAPRRSFKVIKGGLDDS